MRRILFILYVVCISVAVSAANVTYTADESTIFPNPERGFITMLTGHLTQSKPNAVKGKESYLDAHASDDKGTLILVHYYLDNFKSEITISLQHPLPSMLHDAPMFSSGIGSKPASFEDRVTVPSPKT